MIKVLYHGLKKKKNKPLLYTKIWMDVQELHCMKKVNPKMLQIDYTFEVVKF